MKKIISFILVVTLTLSACRVYFRPSNKKFPYYKKATDKNIVRTDGIYYNNYIKKDEISQTIIRFYEDYSAQIVIFNSLDTLIPNAVEVFDLIKKRRSKIDKGYYYIEDNIVNIEILDGFSHTGYFFMRFAGKYNSKGELIIYSYKSIPYKKPRFSNHVRLGIPVPFTCKFYKVE